VRRLLGYLPQEFGLYPKVSAEEMLDHFAALKGIARRSERRDVVHALLRKTNLFEVRKKPLGGYSGGMKQRFGIAQALLGNPRLIIVDEPTAGLDPEERVRFHNLLAEIGENVIVILSTHIVGDVADLCHAMAILHRGEVKLAGEPLALVAALEGRIFETTVHDKAALPELLGRHRVVSTRLVAGRTKLRVYAEQAPHGFTPATADLEDVYFATIRDFAP
jgi:ABC-type multidrug transport system ATPase subunit